MRVVPVLSIGQHADDAVGNGLTSGCCRIHKQILRALSVDAGGRADISPPRSLGLEMTLTGHLVEHGI